MTQGTKEMEYKYDAFISYRHAEKDTKIASEIQQSLERFRIPSALRKKTGKQRFNRIFRDVEELPISSNLTEELTEALRDSQYLIVICSFKTSESDWVKREIETFLELHDYNKQLVLTVLVEGEPDEVIPEILRHDNIIHYLADGSFYCKDEIVEPLAADYRMPIHKARKIELPRLAASMLGCNYDDIIRRRKAFKRRRLLIETAIVSIAAVALITYIGWTLMKIQSNLRSAQMNQSRYLATESVRLLEDGDRISALQLAIAALENSDGTSRPVTSEAEYALSAALGAYQTWASSVASPVWRYEVSSKIVKYDCDKTSRYIMILDTAGTLHIWDRNERKETVFNSEDGPIFDFVFDKDGNLIVMGKGFAALYETASMTQKWRFKNKDIVTNHDVNMAYYRDKEYVALNAGDTLFILNAVDGSTAKEIRTEDVEIFKNKRKKTKIFFSTTIFAINSDFSKVVFAGKDGLGLYSLYIYDAKKDSWMCAIEDSGMFLNVVFDSEGNVMVLRLSQEASNLDYYYENNNLYDVTSVLELVSPQGKSLWKNEYTTGMPSVKTQVTSVDYVTKDKQKLPAVAATYANRFVIVDKKTGESIRSVDFPGSIINVGYDVNDGFATASVLIQNGTAYFVPVYEGGKQIPSRRFFPDGTLKMTGFKSEGVSTYLIEDVSERVITEFSGRFSDKKFVGFEGTQTMPYFIATSKSANGEVFIAFSEKTDKIMGVDVKNNKGLWLVDVPKCRTLVSYDAFSPDGKYTYILKEKTEGDSLLHSTLLRVNCLTGEFEDASPDFEFKGLVASGSGNGKIYAIADADGNEERFTIFMYDIASGTVRKTAVNIKELKAFSYLSKEVVISPDGKKLLFYINVMVDENSTKTVRLMIDPETGKYTASDCNCIGTAFWNEESTLFAEINEDGNITVSSTDGKEKYKVDAEMRKILGLTFHENNLLVVYNTGAFCRYNSIGKLIMDVRLKHGDIASSSAAKFEFVRNFVFVTAGDYTDIINLLDKKCICSFSGFVCLYNSKEAELSNDLSKLKIVSKTFSQTEKDICRVGWFDYKSVPAMLAEAKEYLKQNGVTVSADLKRKYGIE